MFDRRSGVLTREWFLWFKSIDDWANDLNANPFVTSLVGGILALEDGVAAPAAVVGLAQEFVDVADGDLKIRYGDGVTKLIVADT